MSPNKNADDGRLSKLETQFNARHKRWTKAPDGPLQSATFRKMNEITDRILEERAHGIAGMRIKLRTWMEWYGDSGFGANSGSGSNSTRQSSPTAPLHAC